MNTTDQFVTVSGGDVFVRTWEVPGSTLAPIVLLHESLGCVDLWRGFPANLAHATGRTVYAYDRLGYGKSTERTDVETIALIENEAARFPALAQALELDEFVLLGHSVGGGMSLTIAANDPRCAAVISIGAQAFTDPSTVGGVLETKARFDKPEELARLAKYHGDKARWVVDAWTGTWLSESALDWKLDRLHEVHCPVLVIHGERDEYGGVIFGELIRDGVAGASELVVLPLGHHPHLEDEPATLDAIVNFLGQPALTP